MISATAPRPTGPIWPTDTQMLLLQVLLGPQAAARAAWRQWVERVDLMDLDDGANRLLPMLYNRLRQLGIDHPLRDRIKGVYRHAAYRNRLLSHRAAKLIESMAERGIEVMLLKGIALAEHHYQDCADRPMGDVDIMVRKADAARTIALLAELGDWRPLDTDLLADRDALRHAQGYANAQGFSVDLHWNLLPELGYYPDATDRLWQRSRAARFHGQSVRLLSPEDQLFHLCAHGLRWNNGSCLRWGVDSVQLMRSVESFDWDALLLTAERYRHQVLLREALGFLGRSLAAPVPAEVLRRLEAADPPPHGERQFALSSAPRGLLGVLPAFWAGYRLHTDGRRHTAGLPSFSRCLMSTLGVDHYRQLPRIAASNGWNRLVDWANPATGFGRSANSNAAMNRSKNVSRNA